MSVQHYENFPVASIFCPKRLRPAVSSLYWFARTADDLADEGEVNWEQRLLNLKAYRADLVCTLNGERVTGQWQALFDALSSVIEQCPPIHHSLPFPAQHLHELLDAFEKDIRDTAAGYRYTTRQQLLDYCKLSANPVGRLMLHLFGVDDGTSKAQSDAICSSLQLINFWQDVSIDRPRRRFYKIDEPMQELVCWARELMTSGAPLATRLGGRFGFELRLVIQGGLRILDKIEAQGFDTSVQRPKLNKWDAPRVLYRALLM